MGEVFIFPVPEPSTSDELHEVHEVPIYGQRRVAVERFTGGIKCEECGEQIPPSRLKVKPNATRCIDCQCGAEHDGWSAKQHRDPRP